MKKRNLLIAAGVVAAGVCIWLIARPSKGPKVLLETAPISHITIRNSVTATGTVEPVTQVEVGTQVSGIIDKLYAGLKFVCEGKRVFSFHFSNHHIAA